jgi:hypothetical protein
MDLPFALIVVVGDWLRKSFFTERNITEIAVIAIADLIAVFLVYLLIERKDRKRQQQSEDRELIRDHIERGNWLAEESLRILGDLRKWVEVENSYYPLSANERRTPHLPDVFLDLTTLVTESRDDRPGVFVPPTMLAISWQA